MELCVCDIQAATSGCPGRSGMLSFQQLRSVAPQAIFITWKHQRLSTTGARFCQSEVSGCITTNLPDLLLSKSLKGKDAQRRHQ